MIELNGTASIARNIAEARQKNGANINTDTVHMLKLSVPQRLWKQWKRM